VLVVDDHELFSELMVHALRLAGFDDATCVEPRTLDLESTLTKVADVRPDVVLLDLLLGPAGVSTHYIGPLRELGATVLVLTASEDAALLAECVEAGAAGVFSKACPFAELIEVLTDAVRGETVLSPTAREELLDVLHRRRADERTRVEPFERLTQREGEVLRALVKGRAAEEIAASDGVSVTTVRAQIRAVLQKLGVNSQLAAVALARRAGWPEEA
jgi:DNA-binding NarL/FixJ family response regulator